MLDVASAVDLHRVDPRNWTARHFAITIGVVGFLVLPNVIGPFTTLTFISMFYFAMFVMSWDVVSGYTGQFSFGHTFLFAIGGYTSALMNLNFGLPPALSIPIGTLAAVFAGLLFGAPAIRLRGPYFAILTFLLPSILLDVFVLFSDTLGGSEGLSPPEQLIQAGGLRENIFFNYYLALGVFLVVLFVLFFITRSRMGSVFKAINADEAVVSNAGYNPAKYKILSFAISAAVGGFAAALYVHTPVGGPTPSQLLALGINIEIIFAAVIGGIGTIGGAAVGGILFFLVRDYIRSSGFVVPVVDVPVAEFDFVLFSIVILTLIYWNPDGILPWLVEKTDALKTRFDSR